MNFDLQTTLITVGVVIVLILLVWLLLRSIWGKQSIRTEEPEQETADPYVASKERPYMQAPPPPPPPPPPAAPVETLPAPEPSNFHARDIRVDGVPVERTQPDAPAASPLPDVPAAAPPAGSFAPPPPPAPAAEPAQVPEPEPEPEIAPASPPLLSEIGGIAFPPGATDHQDDLTKLKGVGPKLAAMLNQEGITQYGQLGALSEDELAAIDARLGNFRGRLKRDRVVEQARLLASGDREGFEATFGKLGG